jgi:hypothetical protein
MAQEDLVAVLVLEVILTERVAVVVGTAAAGRVVVFQLAPEVAAVGRMTSRVRTVARLQM